jgi:hypothetical protein
MHPDIIIQVEGNDEGSLLDEWHSLMEGVAAAEWDQGPP